MKSKSVALETRLGPHEVASVVNAALDALHADVEPIASSPNPHDNLEGIAAIAFVGQRAALLHMWAVQVYIHDLGEKTGVELVALGDDGLSRAWHGLRSSASLAASVRKRDTLVARLRVGDPQLQLIA